MTAERGVQDIYVTNTKVEPQIRHHKNITHHKYSSRQIYKKHNILLWSPSNVLPENGFFFAENNNKKSQTS